VTIEGLNILFAGSGEFGVPTLRRLLERGGRVKRVYSQPSKPAGRGNKLTPTPIARFAREQGLEVVETTDINADPLPPADALVVIAFGQKLAPHVVDHASLGAINLHASRLPRYRGAAPINWAVINGDSTTGNSVIRLAQRMDAGAVLAMSELPIHPHDTAGDIHDRLSLDGAGLVESVLCSLRAGTAQPLEQDHTQATKAPKLTRESSKLDFSSDATSIANQIRGLYPWPGCRVRVLDDNAELTRMTLIRAEPIAGGASSIGRFQSDLSIACGRGALKLIDVQPEGKRPMSFTAFCNGHAISAGMRLESII
jgi:methionyl-tRNA formyltransferase